MVDALQIGNGEMNDIKKFTATNIYIGSQIHLSTSLEFYDSFDFIDQNLHFHAYHS